MAASTVAILGAGPAGVGAAWRLAKQGRRDVVVLERQPRVGGNSGSFEIEGMWVDYGSHRLHPACDPKIMADIKERLGPALLDRPRHGRIRLRGRWIHFPLRPVDLVTHLPPSFAMGVAADGFGKLLRRRSTGDGETFESILVDGLGKTICRDFYFPYAVKLWGLEPTELSPSQARRRVAAGSLSKLMRKVMSAVPGLKPPGAGRFFYPKNGFGQITQAFADAAVELGADIRLNSQVTRVRFGSPHIVETKSGDEVETLESEHLWSTIPITVLAKMADPSPPEEVMQAAESITYRSMILIYLVLEQDRFSEYDAHYFPEVDIAISRMSEPKNYANRTEPKGRTVLCGELPCQHGDSNWNSSDEQLGELMVDAIKRSGLNVTCPVSQVVTRRLACAYPIYTRGFETHFARLDDWVGGLERVLTFGRQGLFAHDNTHHALAMAYGAVDCLSDSRFDQNRWSSYRKAFESHVVED